MPPTRPCPECDTGILEEKIEDYRDTGPDGETVLVPNVRILRCNACGQELIPAASLEQIENFVAEANEELTPAELYAFLEQFDLNQKEAAEILGLGEKTVHRWLKGVGIVSRSMGYYLRLLQAHPNCMAWLRNRTWRQPAPQPVKSPAPAIATGKFAALAGRRKTIPFTGSNPARGLTAAVCAR